MNNSHPSEKEIQQWAIDKSACPPEVNSHIESCVHCLTEAETYQHLFSGIKQQPSADFDFDLSGLVLSQLPRSVSGLSAENFIAGFLIIFSCCCIALPLILFRKNIFNMFSGIPPFFIYAIIISTSIILAIQVGFMYKKYQNQMRLLNFN